MTEFLQKSPLFPTAFSADLARTTVAALRENALSEWRSNAERFYDYDDREADGEASIDLLKPPVRRVFEHDVRRKPDSIEGVPVAETMSPDEVEQCFADGIDPWACTDLEVSPLWEIQPRPVVVLAIILMCAMIKDEQALGQVFRAGGITLMLCSSGQMRSQLENVAPEVLAHWQENQPYLTRQKVACHIYTNGSDTVASEQKRSIPKFRQAIDKSLMRRAPVLAVSSAKHQLSAEQESLVYQSFRWPSLSANAVIETLRFTHSNTGQLAEDELLRRLPDSDALRRLEPLQVAAAFEETTTLRAADRISQIVAVQNRRPRITLSDVEGLGDAMPPLKRMLGDIDAWREGRAAWSDVTRSAIFYGPPGTGKTMLANAFAGSAGIPLVTTSYSDCQRHGHQGDMLAALATAFERAAQKAPAVLFIDEIDSFSDRSSKRLNDGYLRGVVNGLLEQVNHAAEVEGLILLGATNHLDIVDPAVLRSGRFDLKVEIPLPDRSGLEAILARKLGSANNAALNLSAIAERILGEPGATAEALVRDALSRARTDHLPLAQRHLDAATDQIAPALDTALIHRVAIHEAGHLLSALLSPLPTPLGVWVTARGGRVEPAPLATMTSRLAKAKLRMCLAGREAETLVLSEVSNGAGVGPASDLAQATVLATQMELNWSFGESGLAWQDVSQMDFRKLPLKTQQRIEAHLQEAETAVRALLKDNIDMLKNIAAELVQRKELTRMDLLSLSKLVSFNAPTDDNGMPSEFLIASS
ncbi:AAA family ATPase [Sulfitobacter litoralis]|jgi:cell division protease FtsH|uniref:AAA family ATPase n=1 Tax=Sulfitobacter litoralis TaxID=335975 RepID=UPI0030EF7880|tara:strand:+ start:3265 stop:5541 length:2277 start_codon:yes stop_codon:yes gene_type:complete